VRSYILTEAEREALLRYISGADVKPTGQVSVTLHRWRRHGQRLKEDLELLRTASEDRLPLHQAARRLM